MSLDGQQKTLERNRRASLNKLHFESLAKLEKMSRGIEDESDDDKIAMLSQKSQHTSLGNTEIAEDDIGGEMNWFKMRIELPKL